MPWRPLGRQRHLQEAWPDSPLSLPCVSAPGARAAGAVVGLGELFARGFRGPGCCENRKPLSIQERNRAFSVCVWRGGAL